MIEFGFTEQQVLTTADNGGSDRKIRDKGVWALNKGGIRIEKFQPWRPASSETLDGLFN